MSYAPTAVGITEQRLTLKVSEKAGSVSALLERPPRATALYVLSHGAGAGMHHVFMTDISAALHARGIATLRFQFPYTERGGRRPDPKPWLVQTIAAAVTAGANAMPSVPLLAGGKSMGGRMTSHLAAQSPAPPIDGLVFLGFPLHPSGKEGIERAAHLPRVTTPMLFVQGTRDKLADLPLIRGVVDGLGPHARMHVVEGADHGFAVLKRSGRTPADVLAELATTVATFITELID